MNPFEKLDALYRALQSINVQGKVQIHLSELARIAAKRPPAAACLARAPALRPLLTPACSSPSASS